ncbi:MAG: TetR/AcrR family transcriptional regulator [Acidobacteria bacterium]|nr:TetR/AcrR family transcriptional regulator [Acidobacteriota bacterium]
MSGNRKEDARVRRTRDALGDALVALMTERAFESITVQDVLDRAGVSRSTFYVHYSGKDDLLGTDVDEFWAHMANRLSSTKEQSDRVAPVRELFAHVAGMGEFRGALDAAGKLHEVTEAGRAHFAHAIEERLARSGRASHLTAAHREAIAHAQAGAIFALLDWWLENGETIPAAEVDELFHRAFWSGVARR